MVYAVAALVPATALFVWTAWRFHRVAQYFQFVCDAGAALEARATAADARLDVLDVTVMERQF